MFPTNIKSGLKSALLLGVSSAAVGLSIPAAYADTVETVVVTGSRIPNRDFTSDSPISTVSAESLKATGVVEVTALLNTLPQVVPAFSSGSNNPPSGGLQAVDLRGLGPNRNIVLIDGRRAAPATIGGVVDIQTIPQSLIDRVEVITGGASAVYGPDAITGVVNFILKDNFEGAAADAQYGISDRGDNITESASMTIGGNFADGKGNAVITFDWAKRNPVTDAERDFANQATSLTSYFPDGVFRPSGNKPLQSTVDAYFATHGGALPGHISNAQNFVFNPNNTLFNSGGVGVDVAGPDDFSGTPSGVFNFASDPSFPAQRFCADPTNPANCQTYSYNFQPPNLLIVPLNRRNFMGQAHYDINEYVTAYGSAHFTSYHSASSLAPSPAPTSGVTSPTGENCGTAYCVPVNRDLGLPTEQLINPYLAGTDLATFAGPGGFTFITGRTGNNANLLSAGATEDILIRTRFLQLGPRLQDNGINAYQVTGGFRGNLPWLNNSFHYDVFASYGNNDTLTLQFGNVSNSAVEKALYGKATDDAGCVAYDATLAPQFRGYCGYNPFGHDKMSAAAASYVARIAKNSVNTTFTDIEATFGGDIMQLPAGAMAFSLGADYREQTYNFIPDPLLASGDISGFNSASPVQGAVYDREVFGELYIPVLKDHAWADSLSITLGGRYTNQAHTTDGSPYTWKAEGDWTVLHTLTFRGSYQVATRVPNIGELFTATLQNNPVLADPCNADGPFRALSNPHHADVLALCQAQAARFSGDLNSFNPNYIQGTTQILAKSGGTLNLRPETADTVTLGVAFQSDSENPWFSNFKASVDYWNIDLHAPIGVDFFDIMYGCFNADGSNPTYSPLAPSCVDNTPAHNPRIVRSSSGSIYYLNAFSGNLAKNQLDGIDVAIQWGLDLADTVGADPKWGNLGFNFAGTWLHEFNVQGTQAGSIINYAGTIGATSPIGLTTDAALPEWKATLTTTWNFLDDFSLTSRVNYISAMENSLNKVGWGGFPLSPSTVTGVPSTWYFDVSGGWNVTDHLSVRAGVTNVFDQQPRIYNPSQQDGTDPTTYDIVGRSYFMGVSVKY